MIFFCDTDIHDILDVKVVSQMKMFKSQPYLVNQVDKTKRTIT